METLLCEIIDEDDSDPCAIHDKRNHCYTSIINERTHCKIGKELYNLKTGSKFELGSINFSSETEDLSIKSDLNCF